jgi:chromosomal replication initiator protein
MLPSSVSSIDRIKKAICLEFGLRRVELESRQRKRDVVIARMIGMALARQLTDLTLTQIGRRFGNRDHTRVIYASQRMGRVITVAAQALPAKATPKQWARAVQTAMELPE